MSGEIHKRLDSIRTILSSFRVEQEQLILKSADDQRFRSSKNSIAPPIAPSDSTNEEVYLSRVLNMESIVMPVGSSASAGQKLWPQAMLSARYGDTSRMGNIESNGSLWKVIPRKDGAAGTRVVLQSAEIGEEQLFLNPNLQMVQNKGMLLTLRLNKLNIFSRLIKLISIDCSGRCCLEFACIGQPCGYYCLYRCRCLAFY